MGQEAVVSRGRDRSWALIAAVTLVLAPVLLVATEMLMPENPLGRPPGDGDAGWFVSHVLLFAATALLLAAIPGLVGLGHGRSAWAAWLGASLMWIGATSALAITAVDFVAGVLADGGDHEAMAVLHASIVDAAIFETFDALQVLLPVGLVVLVIAAAVARSVSWWSAGLVVVAVPLGSPAISDTVAIAGRLLLFVGLVPMAVVLISRARVATSG